MGNYKEEIKEYVDSIKSFLTEKHGYIRNSWFPLIEMLANEYEIYLIAKQEVETNGLLVQTSRGLFANPAVKIKNDALVQIGKLVNELHLSPKSESKLGKENTESTQDIIEALMS